MANGRLIIVHMRIKTIIKPPHKLALLQLVRMVHKLGQEIIFISRLPLSRPSQLNTLLMITSHALFLRALFLLFIKGCEQRLDDFAASLDVRLRVRRRAQRRRFERRQAQAALV